MHYLIANINDYTDEELDNFYENIYDVKKKKIDKIQNTERKKQSIIGEILLSKLLKEFYNTNYNNLTFDENENGKPFIKNRNIYFNISHSNDYVVTVISNYLIGIDIEKIKKVNNNLLDIISNNDILDYNDKNIITLYTLKEAYLKMKGLNIKSINEASFIIGNNIKCLNDDINVNVFEYNDYMISICEKKN